MAASFLQYCATCEKQIVVLNNSILYCSESCRVKDNSKDNSKLFAYPQLYSGSEGLSISSASWITLAAGDPLKPPPEIIPQLAPTKPQQPRSPLSPKYQADLSTSPSSCRCVNGNGDNAETKPYSPAAQSLKQLQNYTTTRAQPYRANTAGHRSTPTSPNMSSHGSSSLYRPALLRSNKSSSSTLPSLTTSSGTSSPTSSPPMLSLPHHAANPHPSYTYTTERPLPPRSNSSAYSASPRSIDLVTPHPTANTPRSSVADNNMTMSSGGGLGIEGGELLYEKNWTLPSVGRQSGSGSLKRLFNFEGMQGRPSSGYPVGGYEMARQGRAVPQSSSVAAMGYRGGL